mmetsp:Transcript_37661/g.57694  ORF Transcript_37661/g.57694 Transcript_37661/m.57694 type:complete len:85 (-) Transcript_37661:818-1072(-)
MLLTQTGTPFYCPPEIWEDQPYTSKCDVWSLGCVIYELACLRPPFQGRDLDTLHRRVVKGQYLPIPKHFSVELEEMIDFCLTTD